MQSRQVRIANCSPMGDTSPKNIHKLAEKKHEEHVKKEDDKHENAERQHHHTHAEAESEADAESTEAEK